MATDVILPALGMSQDTGKILQWFKREGDHVAKGEPLVEVETDKAAVEIEAPAEGVLARVSASAGEDVPVGQVIAAILSGDEVVPGNAPRSTPETAPRAALSTSVIPAGGSSQTPIVASPLATRIANEHHLDLRQVRTDGRRIQKADVLSYLQSQAQSAQNGARLQPASPKARRLAAEQGIDLAEISGSGPGGAVLAADVLASAPPALPASARAQEAPETNAGVSQELSLGTIWRVMAQHTTQSWTSVPHFYLMREVNVTRMIAWREQAVKQGGEKVTYTDLLVKVVAAALRKHPRVNASWRDGKVTQHVDIHVGLAVAIEDGLVVPVIRHADTLGLATIAQQRKELVQKAQARKLRPQDISDGTFTISNLGMYGVDAFNAIISEPQAAILAVGRIAERVVPVNGQPAVQPMIVLTLSCDHRVIDGARGAQFLETLVAFIEEPLGLLG